MSDNMIVKIEFPTYDSLNSQFKSLVNFFMEHAELCFVDTSFSSSQPDNTELSGCIIFYNYNSSNKYLAIPFKNYFSEEFPEFPSLPVSNLSTYSSLETMLNDTFFLHDNNGVTPLFTNAHTQLLQCNTALSLYEAISTTSSKIRKINSVSIPVVLKPMIGNGINENSQLKPTDIANDVHDDDYEYRQYPMSVYSIDKQNKVFSYDFQYRTSSFSVKTENNQTINNVFYKIGFCFTNPEMSDLTLSDIFENQCFDITVYSSCTGSGLNFRFYNDDYSGPIFNGYMVFDESYSGMYPKHNLSFSGDMGLPASFIIGISYSVSSMIGLCYVKLYNNDGTPCNNEELMNGKSFALYVSDSESSLGDLTSRLRLNITNQQMDGGFIASSTFND